MSINRNSRKIYILIGVLFFIAFVVFIFYPKPSQVEATNHWNNMNGWAWSDNIGWISLTCDNDSCSDSDYRVRLDPFTGIFTGYAWSSNIGWIQFDSGSGYPESPFYDAKMVIVPAAICSSEVEVSGWIRALSYGGGWDGWIKMAGSTGSGGHYGVCLSVDGEHLDGFAWGGDVVGWVEFDENINSIIRPPTSPIHIKEIRPN
ncbi:MAG TPA: hypothetical protein VI432_00335 [Candidatus Paceibacterota bacterium]